MTIVDNYEINFSIAQQADTRYLAQFTRPFHLSRLNDQRLWSHEIHNSNSRQATKQLVNIYINNKQPQLVLKTIIYYVSVSQAFQENEFMTILIKKITLDSHSFHSEWHSGRYNLYSTLFFHHFSLYAFKLLINSGHS